MKYKTITQIILTADEGKYLTDGETCGKTVVLPDHADPAAWREITEEEKKQMEQEVIEIG